MPLTERRPGAHRGLTRPHRLTGRELAPPRRSGASAETKHSAANSTALAIICHLPVSFLRVSQLEEDCTSAAKVMTHKYSQGHRLLSFTCLSLSNQSQLEECWTSNAKVMRHTNPGNLTTFFTAVYFGNGPLKREACITLLFPRSDLWS